MQVGRKWVNQFLTHTTHYANFRFWVDPPLDPQGHKRPGWLPNTPELSVLQLLKRTGSVENNSNLVMHKLILTIKKEQYISKVYDLSRALRSAANSNSPVLVTVATYERTTEKE